MSSSGFQWTWTYIMSVNVTLVVSVLSFLICIISTESTVNIAIGKPTSQSSNLQYPNSRDIWISGNAVDGNKACNMVDKDHFSATKNEQRPWWMVDLKQTFLLSKIIIYGQKTESPIQLKGFQVFILTTENGNLEKIYDNANIVYGNGKFVIPVKPHKMGRYVKIVMPGTFRVPVNRTGPLVLCEVEVYGQAELIQTLRNAVSTDMSPYYSTWGADKAIDNENKYDANACSCCSATIGSGIPWWRINMKKPYVIFHVQIFGRSDQSNVFQSENLYVYGSNTTDVNGTLLYHGNHTYGTSEYLIDLPQPRLFQFLTIRRWKRSLMTVCEVKMFQEGCPIGHFGDKCLSQCHCANGASCGINSGKCEYCATGWTGDACDLRITKIFSLL